MVSTRLREVLEEIRQDRFEDFSRLLDIVVAGEAPSAPSGLGPFFELLRGHRDILVDARPLAVVSVGGSNTKWGILSFNADGVRWHYAAQRPNPEAPEPADRFFSEILLGDAAMRGYFLAASDPALGVSLAVPFAGAVPYHPGKITTVDGLVAKKLGGDLGSYNFFDRIERTFVAEGVSAPRLFFQGDAPVAHLGALGLAESFEDRSILLVCGNGLAAADDDAFIIHGMLPLLAHPILFPSDETLGGQYQYAVAGKGLAHLLRRSLAYIGDEAAYRGLAAPELLQEFATDADSRKLFELRESDSDFARQIYGRLSDSECEILRDVTSAMIDRAAYGLTNIGAAAVAANQSKNGSAGSYAVFYEGSILRNSLVAPVVESQMEDLAGQQDLFEAVGIPTPAAMYRREPNLTVTVEHESYFDFVDVTMVGAGVGASLVRSHDLNSHITQT